MAELDCEAFDFDSGLERYEAAVEIGAAQVAVRVAREAFEDRSVIVELVAVVAREVGRVLDQVVDELLEDKNDDWLSDGESSLSKQDFRRGLTLQAIELGPGGEIELAIDDDGIFWGHELTVALDADYRIARVNLEG